MSDNDRDELSRVPHEGFNGQDDPPDVDTALRAVIGLLADLHDRLRHPDARHDDDDLALRVTAMRAALRRLLQHRRKDVEL